MQNKKHTNYVVEDLQKETKNLLETAALTTSFEKFIAWGRKNSMWPLPYGTACCGIELMSVLGPKYDLARFGAEVVRFSPRQSDLLLVAGTITEKMAPVLIHIYKQMLEPKYVLSMGACASSGGFYRAYHVLQGIDKVIPVDVYVPGCPPTPEAVLDGVMVLQKMIEANRPRPWKDNWKDTWKPHVYQNNQSQMESTPHTEEALLSITLGLKPSGEED